MIYRIGACLVTFGLFLGVLAAADDPKPEPPEPPVRLKKKDKPKVDPQPEKKLTPPKKDEPKKKDAKDDEPGDAREQAEDPKVVLERLAKNMKDSAERLTKTDPGEGTRQVQRDIIKDLDALLNQMRQQQNDPSGGSSSSSPQKSDDKQAQSGSKRTQQRMARGQRRSSRNRMARGNQGQRNQPQDRQTNSGGTNPGGGGQGNKNMADKRSDPYKDVWGHLPEALRMQMDAYAREKFMAKYDDLLKQYYATIAEKERR